MAEFGVEVKSPQVSNFQLSNHNLEFQPTPPKRASSCRRPERDQAGGQQARSRHHLDDRFASASKETAEIQFITHRGDPEQTQHICAHAAYSSKNERAAQTDQNSWSERQQTEAAWPFLQRVEAGAGQRDRGEFPSETAAVPTERIPW